MRRTRWLCCILAVSVCSVAAARPRATAGKRNYFWEYPLQNCRVDNLGALGSVELCAISTPAKGEKKREFAITLRDPSRLEKGNPQTAEHVLIKRLAPTVDAGWYLEYEMVAWHELGDRAFLIDVPLVQGDPGTYSAKRHDFYLLRVAGKKRVTIKRAWQSPVCQSDICHQSVQLRSSVGSKEKTILFIDSTDRRKTKTITLTWNGRKLLPKK